LLTIALRDPAPPLFGPGFGVKERVGPEEPFRWCGTAGRLVVAGLQGPPVALLQGVRPSDAGPTTLLVTDASGRAGARRTVPPGRFDLAIASPPVFGPLPAPTVYTVSCDRPIPLPAIAGGMRPAAGCFVFGEVTDSRPPERLWERIGD